MYGLVLEGGGAKGSYHIGAYKAILEEGLEVKGIAGTSIGALNGAMIVQGDYEKCCELWQDLKYSMVIDANDEEIHRIRQVKLDREDLRLLSDKIRAVIKDRGFDITPFKDLLNNYIDEDRIRNSTMDFAIVTVNLTDLKPIKIFKEDIPYGEMKNYLLASAYLPAFKKEKIKGIRYLDGGFYDNLPYRLLQSRGYKDLIIVRTHARGITRKIDPKLNAIIISPSDDIGESFVFEHESARRNIELGYYDGLKAIRGLKGIKYYINPKGEEYFFELLKNINEDQIAKIRQYLKIPNIPDKRTLFENIIPKAASFMGLRRNYDYEDFALALLERKAEAFELNRFQIYDYEELLDKVKCTPKKQQHSHSEQRRLSRIIEKVDLSAIFNKEEIILKLADIILCDN
jgi:NTE family protein